MFIGMLSLVVVLLSSSTEFLWMLKAWWFGSVLVVFCLVLTGFISWVGIWVGLKYSW